MFRDRLDAAMRLAWALGRYREDPNAVVLAVPRGGLAVGEPLARELGLRLGVFMVKRLAHPEDPDISIGAVGLAEAEVAPAAKTGGIALTYLAEEVDRLRAELRRSYLAYQAVSPPPNPAGRSVILVDDGAATGRTLLLAIGQLRREGSGRIVAALPAAPPETVATLRGLADEVVCLETPDGFSTIADLYDRFPPVSDEEALDLLRRGKSSGPHRGIR